MNRCKSMIEMDYTESYQDKYIFHYTKSKWRTDYNELMSADLR